MYYIKNNKLKDNNVNRRLTINDLILLLYKIIKNYK